MKTDIFFLLCKAQRSFDRLSPILHQSSLRGPVRVRIEKTIQVVAPLLPLKIRLVAERRKLLVEARRALAEAQSTLANGGEVDVAKLQNLGARMERHLAANERTTTALSAALLTEI